MQERVLDCRQRLQDSIHRRLLDNPIHYREDALIATSLDPR